MATFLVAMSAIPVFGAFIVAAGMFGSIPDSIEHSKALKSAFTYSASYIESFFEKNKRLPTKEEFADWKKALPPDQLEAAFAEDMRIIAPEELPHDVALRFGAPPENAYALEVWRGEWNEYYASWTHDSTPHTAAAGLYLRAVAELACCVVLVFVLWNMVIRIRPKAAPV